VVVIAVVGIGLVRNGYPWKPIALGAAAVLVVSTVAFDIASHGELLNRVVTAFTSAEAGIGYQRFGIWGYALKAVALHPLLGTGPDTLASASKAAFGFVFSDDAHDLPLQLSLTVGVFAAAALYTFFGWTGWSSRKAAFSVGEGLPHMALTAAFAASAGYLTHTLVGVSLVTSTAMLFVCVGVLLGASSDEGRDVGGVLLGAASLLAVVLLAVTLSVGGRAIAADHAYVEARIAAHFGGNRLAWAQRAVALDPLNDMYSVELRMATRAAAGQ
jgi:hypothetical protein